MKDAAATDRARNRGDFQLTVLRILCQPSGWTRRHANFDNYGQEMHSHSSLHNSLIELERYASGVMLLNDKSLIPALNRVIEAGGARPSDIHEALQHDDIVEMGHGGEHLALLETLVDLCRALEAEVPLIRQDRIEDEESRINDYGDKHVRTNPAVEVARAQYAEGMKRPYPHWQPAPDHGGPFLPLRARGNGMSSQFLDDSWIENDFVAPRGRGRSFNPSKKVPDFPKHDEHYPDVD